MIAFSTSQTFATGVGHANYACDCGSHVSTIYDEGKSVIRCWCGKTMSLVSFSKGA